MVSIEWDKARGWHDARVDAYGPLALIRPRRCCTTARKSSKASRPIATPTAPSDLPSPGQRRAPATLRRATGVAAVAGGRVRRIAAPADRRRPRLGAVEAGNQPYFRPFMIATEAFLGVRAANAVSTSSPARPARISPGRGAGVDLAVAGRARAAKGGTGAAKCGGNYAARCCRSWKPARTVARRCCSSIRSRAGTWKNSVA